MTGHTKGVWTVDGFEVYADEDCETHPVADCTPNGSCRLEDEALANTRLIASAPELLECLMMAEVYVAIEGSDEELKMVQEAIAKATQP